MVRVRYDPQSKAVAIVDAEAPEANR